MLDSKQIFELTVWGKIYGLQEKFYSYCDAVFRLEVLEEERMVAVDEEKFDGYFRIVKLPTTSSIAAHPVKDTDLVFEVHRKYFEIRVHHLPPQFLNKGNGQCKSLCDSVSDEF